MRARVCMYVRVYIIGELQRKEDDVEHMCAQLEMERRGKTELEMRLPELADAEECFFVKTNPDGTID